METIVQSAPLTIVGVLELVYASCELSVPCPVRKHLYVLKFDKAVFSRVGQLLCECKLQQSWDV